MRFVSLVKMIRKANTRTPVVFIHFILFGSVRFGPVPFRYIRRSSALENVKFAKLNGDERMGKSFTSITAFEIGLRSHPLWEYLYISSIDRAYKFIQIRAKMADELKFLEK